VDCPSPSAPPADDCETEGNTLLSRMSHGLYVKTVECCVSTTVLVIVLCVCLLCYYYCISCLLGVVLVSICLCPFLPYFNIPLWIGIFILVLSGYRITNGKLALVWE
jgi:hypothetical protein